MTDAKKAEPEEDLLEFLGGIDEGNEDSEDSDFADFLANTDIEKVTRKPGAPANRRPAKDGNRE